MATILQSITKTIENEGGFVDNQNDPGGATKYGITQTDLDESYGPATFPVSALSSLKAAEWYLTTTEPERYNNPLYSQIQSQALCDKLFDMGVLFGVGTAVAALQTALGAEADGDFGPVTLSICNRAPVTILQEFKSRMVAVAESISTVHPTEAEFLDGWVRRIEQ